MGMSLAYLGCVGLGVVLGIIAATLQESDLPRAARNRIRVAAISGAILGAYLFELPADLLGLTEAAHDHQGRILGGRTILGGIAGAWLAVEWQKHRLGIRASTGDGFVAPLCISLCLGRFGCFFGGCCWGAPSPGWPLMPWMDTARIPVPLFEALFHGSFALLAVFFQLRWKRGGPPAVRGQLFLFFVTAYSAARFLFEYLRPNPRSLGGITYYQWLALGLGLAALAVAARRQIRAQSE